jgi:hypothetical protein
MVIMGGGRLRARPKRGARFGRKAKDGGNAGHEPALRVSLLFLALCQRFRIEHLEGYQPQFARRFQIGKVEVPKLIGPAQDIALVAADFTSLRRCAETSSFSSLMVSMGGGAELTGAARAGNFAVKAVLPQKWGGGWCRRNDVRPRTV